MRAVVRAVSLRRLWLEPGRTGLLVLGVALGVSVLVAIRVLNATATRALERTGEVQAGAAALEVDAGPGGVPSGLLATARETEGVRAATPVIARYAREAPRGKRSTEGLNQRVLVLGLDLLDAKSREAYLSASGVVELGDASALATTPVACLSTRAFAERRGLKPGDTVLLYTQHGRTPIALAGTFDQKGPLGQVLGGDVLVVSIRLAEALFGPAGRVDRIEISLAPGARRDDVERRLRERLGAGVAVGVPGKRDVQQKSLIGTTQLGLELASLLALLIGVFLVYNAMSIAIVRRRPEIGVLRAVGATKKHVALLFFAEAVAFGLLGAGLGLGLGLGLARVTLDAMGAQISQLYLPLDLRHVELAWRDVAIGLIAGPVATVLASVPPVVLALRVSPVEAARKDLPRRDPVRALTLLAWLGVALELAACAGYLVAGRRLDYFGGAALQLAVSLGAAAIAPRGLVVVVSCVRPLLSRTLGPIGALAGDNLLARPGRAGATVAALMVALGGVLAISTLVASLEAGIQDWLRRVLVADVYVAASSPVGAQNNTLVDLTMLDDLKKVPGVVECFPLRFVFVEAGGGPAMLVAIDMAFFSYRARFPEVEGNLDETLRDAHKGDLVAVSANFARRRGLGIGDRFDVPTPAGATWRPRISLIVVDFTSEHGSFFVERTVYREKFGDNRANAFDVFCAETSTQEQHEAVANEIRARFGESHDLFATRQAPFRESILGVVRSAFRITYAMQLVAIGVALLGVVTTLLAAILERTREIGVLRAIGATRRQIRRAVVVEALLIGGVASAFAVVLGIAMGHGLVTRVIPGVYGWDLPFAVPWEPLAFGAASATFLAAASGLLPAARAARIRIVEALAYE